MPKVEQTVGEALSDQLPVRGLAGVSIQNVCLQPEQLFDIGFEILSGPTRIQVLGEVKPTFSPRLLEEIGPWIRRLKALRPDLSVAVITPFLSSQAQLFCTQNGIDFLDLSGNISINVPGKFTLQRSGMRVRSKVDVPIESARAINVFSGRFSRVLRVLLEKPQTWTVSGIARELEEEGARSTNGFSGATLDFTISQSSVSKVVTGLEEQLWIRRRGTAIIVPEPLRILQQWAEKYKERYRWRLRSSFRTGNPFGRELASIAGGISALIQGPYAFSGAIATTSDAPFVDIDVIDIFVFDENIDAEFRKVQSPVNGGPPLRVITPYDVGVFMYSKQVGTAPVVSSVQAYLDLYARGGRDLKQAEYLLENIIRPQWRTA